MLERPCPTATVLRVWRSFTDGALSEDDLEWLQALRPLASEYRLRFRQRLDAQRRSQDQGALF